MTRRKTQSARKTKDTNGNKRSTTRAIRTPRAKERPDAKLEELIGVLNASREHGPDDFRKLTKATHVLFDEWSNASGDKRLAQARPLIGYQLDYLGEFDKAMQMTPVAGGAPRVRGGELADWLYQLGSVAYRSEDLDKASELLEKALTLFEKQRDSLGRAKALLCQAKIHYRRRDYTHAKMTAHAALQAFLSLPNRASRGYWSAIASLFLARLSFRVGDLSEAQSYVSHARIGLDNTDDLVHRASVLDTRGCIARNRGDYQIAETLFSEALEFLKKAGHESYVLRIQNDLGHTYTQWREFEKATHVLRTALTANPGTTPWFKRIRSQTCSFLARLHLVQGDFAEAIKRSEEAKDLADEVKAEYISIEARVTQARALLESLDETSVSRDENQEQRVNSVAKAVDDIAREIHTLIRHSETNGGGIVVNKKSEVTYNLLMAHARCKGSHPDRTVASAYYDRAIAHLKQIQNSFLADWAKRVAQLMGRLDGSFHLTATKDAGLNFSENLEHLRLWSFVEAAKIAGKNKRGRIDRDAISSLLRVKRQTWEAWIKAWRSNDASKRELLRMSPEALESMLKRVGYNTQDEPLSKESDRPE